MTDFRELGKRLSNWGRWDSDRMRDERGTTNLLTSERIAHTAGYVADGKVFDLGIPLGSDGPQPGGGRINPVLLLSASAASPHGTKRCAIDKQAKGVTGRGVLIDVARYKGVESMQAGEVITPNDLNTACERQGTELRAGDIVAVRTGWRKKFLSDGDAASFMADQPGLGLDCREWLSRHEVAAVCSDNWAVEVISDELDGERLPVLIRDMGMTLGEILDFEELAEDCAADGRYEFFCCAPPIKFRRALGSPINPLAIK